MFYSELSSISSEFLNYWDINPTMGVIPPHGEITLDFKYKSNNKNCEVHTIKVEIHNEVILLSFCHSLVNFI